MYKYLAGVQGLYYTCFCPFLRFPFCKHLLNHISTGSVRNKTVSVRVCGVGDISISQAWQTFLQLILIFLL